MAWFKEKIMQTLVQPTAVSTHPDRFTPYQIRTVERLQKMGVHLVPVPQKDMDRSEKAPFSVLFYDAEGKLNLWRIGQHNILARKVARS